jgi:hypothetical protein
MMKKVVVALYFLGATTTIGQALDTRDLVPCRPAAARFCERSRGHELEQLAPLWLYSRRSQFSDRGQLPRSPETVWAAIICRPRSPTSSKSTKPVLGLQANKSTNKTAGEMKCFPLVAASAASAGALPNIDIQKMCEASEAAPFADNATTFDVCMSDEQAAREKVAEDRANIPTMVENNPSG